MTVYLVGAGPGNPGLLTRRAAHLLAAADVVVHDRLVDPAVLALVRPGAELIDVGKRPVGAEPPHARAQAEINDLLVARARQGGTVVRLKGGDPFVFGRGGEEAEALERAGIDWEVVPGVTSAFALPALAGIPVTHRGRSASVTVVTGHGGDATSGDDVNWEALARAGGTLVVLMGVGTRGDVARRLIEGGRAAATPVTVIERGSTPAERRTRTTLGALGTLALAAPAVIVIGAVAGLELTAAPRPLEGWTVVVTRPADRAQAAIDALSVAGASVVTLPVIETTDPADGGRALAAAAARVGDYDWVALTSATAVERFVTQLRDARALGRARVGAVGDATAAALRSRGIEPDLVAPEPRAAGLARAMPPGPGRVLFPSAAGAGPDLRADLEARTWQVDTVEAYRTVRAPEPGEAAARAASAADAVTFASPSAVAAYVALVAKGLLSVPSVVVCLGPVTAAAAARAGLEVSAVADRPAPEAMVEALASVMRPPGATSAAIPGTGS